MPTYLIWHVAKTPQAFQDRHPSPLCHPLPKETNSTHSVTTSRVLILSPTSFALHPTTWTLFNLSTTLFRYSFYLALFSLSPPPSHSLLGNLLFYPFSFSFPRLGTFYQFVILNLLFIDYTYKKDITTILLLFI